MDIKPVLGLMALIVAVQISNPPPSSSGSMPTGFVGMVTSGTCPTGTTEVAGLAGAMPFGTVAANADVGGIGGSDAVTPAGNVAAPALTMNSYTPGGTNGTGTVTATGTVAWPVNPPTNGAIALGTFVNTATATSGNCAATNIAAGTGSTTACKATAPNLTVPAEGHSGSLTAPTISYPANVPTFAGSAATTSAETFTGNAATLTGTNTAPAFTGTQFDNRSAFVKVIFCKAN